MTYDVHAELLIDDTWVDMSERLRRSSPPVIDRGRPNESSQGQPATASFTLQNTDGHLTPGNAASPWWPYVDLGTQCRLSIDSGVTRLWVDGTSGARARTADHADLDITGDLFVKIEVTLPFFPLPSGVAAKIAGKFASLNRSWVLYIQRDLPGLLWSTDGAASGELFAASTAAPSVPASNRFVLAFWLDVNNGASGRTITFYGARRWDDPLTVLGTPVVQSGTTSIFSGTAPVDLGDVVGSGFNRRPLEVHRFEMRSGTEFGTIVANPDFTAQTPGATSFADTAPTPKTWSIDGTAALRTRAVRFTGEISQIAPRWPNPTLPTASDEGVAHVEIEAAGPLRRMSQGPKRLESSLYRLITAGYNISDVIAYWPFEDGRDATNLSTPIVGGRPMSFGGDVQLAADSTLAGSKPVLQVSGGRPYGFSGQGPLPAGLTNWAVDFFVRIPTRETEPSSTVLGFADATGTVRHWRFAISSTTFRIMGTTSTGGVIVDTSFSASLWTSNWTQVRLRLTQSGGIVTWDLAFAELGGGVAVGLDGTYSGFTGRPTQWRTLDTAPPDGISYGHIVFTTDIAELGWLVPADLGWPGETAGNRIVRLCREEGVPVSIHGDPEATEPMGPQTPDTLLNLLQECAEADMGIFSEQITQPALHYRTRASLYNQEPAVTFDVAGRALRPELEPVRNDQRYRNEVTVERVEGGAATVADPAIEAEGKPRYDESVTRNVASDDQLPPQAGWLYHLGTWPEMRYPGISTQLGKVPALIPDWLNTELGDRALAVNLPRQNAGDLDQIIEQYRERMTWLQWIVDVVGSPAEPWLLQALDVASAVDLTPTARYDRSSTGLTPPFTIMGWFRPDALPADYAALLYAGSVSNNDHVAVFIHPTSVISVWDDSFTLRAETSVVTIGQWIFLALTVDGSGGITFYWRREGDTTLTWDTGTVNVPISSDFLYVGTNRESPNFLHSFNGAVANVRPFSSVLSAADVMRESRSPTAIGAAWADWSFSTLDGADVSGNNRHLTLDAGAGSVSTTRGPDITGSVHEIAGRLDSDGSTLDVAIDDNDVSWTVDVTGPLWTTNPSQFPLRIKIGGEEIALSGISGTSSPQTFTASQRAANGVQKSHAAGAAVNVAEPIRLAL